MPCCVVLCCVGSCCVGWICVLTSLRYAHSVFQPKGFFLRNAALAAIQELSAKNKENVVDKPPSDSAASSSILDDALDEFFSS